MKRTFKNVPYEVISINQNYQISFDGDKCIVNTGDFENSFNVLFQDTRAFIRGQHLEISEKNLLTTMVATGFIFDHYKNIQEVFTEDFDYSTAKDLFENYGLYLNQDRSLKREQYYQLPFFWSRKKRHEMLPEIWTNTNETEHPIRPSYHDGSYYKRYIPEISKTLSFRKTDIQRDLDKFYEWHNKPRVYDLWELNFDKEKLKNYLIEKENDTHTLPLILEFDGIPVGYFEVYWVLEDRLAPYYACNPYDRGFHFLIGEEPYLGIENTGAVLKSISHFIFLDDPRTLKIAAEPRSDNQRVLKYVQMVAGWEFVKEFDFPHKRSALLMCHREKFFAGDPL